MAQRSKQNAITLVGQFSIFIVETLASLLVQMLVIYHDKVEWIDNSVLLPTVILATLGWFKNPVSSQTEKLMAGTKL